MEAERRKRERFPISQTIDLNAGYGRHIPAQGINLSESGLLCQTDVEMAIGVGVTFEITITGVKSDLKVTCEGVIYKCDHKKGKYDVVIDLTDQNCM